VNTPARLVATSVLLSAWLGASLLLATTVAPAAFAALPNRALAGDVVGRVLPVVFVGGLVAGLVVAVLGVGGSWLRMAMALLVALASAVAQFLVAPRIARLRDAMGGVLDAVPPADPRRAEFGRLHGVSVGLLGTAMLAALVLLILSLLALRQRASEIVQ
jgi:hypothetical protein